MVKVPAGETSEVTLPASPPGLQEMTLLGGPMGLTIILPDAPVRFARLSLVLEGPYADDFVLVSDVDT